MATMMMGDVPASIRRKLEKAAKRNASAQGAMSYPTPQPSSSAGPSSSPAKPEQMRAAAQASDVSSSPIRIKTRNTSISSLSSVSRNASSLDALVVVLHDSQQAIMFGRKAPDQLPVATQFVTLPKSAKHASRTHATLSRQETDQIKLEVQGSNGLVYESERLRQGDVRMLTCKANTSAQLDFFGCRATVHLAPSSSGPLTPTTEIDAQLTLADVTPQSHASSSTAQIVTPVKEAPQAALLLATMSSSPCVPLTAKPVEAVVRAPILPGISVKVQTTTRRVPIVTAVRPPVPVLPVVRTVSRPSVSNRVHKLSAPRDVVTAKAVKRARVEPAVSSKSSADVPSSELSSPRSVAASSSLGREQELSAPSDSSEESSQEDADASSAEEEANMDEDEPDESALSIDAPAKDVPKSKAERDLASMDIDMTGLIASSLVFSGRATVFTSAIVKMLLEDQPQLVAAATDISEADTSRTPLRELSSNAEAARQEADVTLQETAMAAWTPLVLAALEHGPFGCIDNKGLKDASGRPLEALWHYLPSRDQDRERRASLEPFVKPLRQSQMRSHQYVWKKPSLRRRR
ncbi:uncharacterized protein L969DRAFT_93284 [Mixia osmundae IAM 14324]|uniref:FHA domain-containing protein n=1 Tax=Mixia osmundae (strain CBS 9802 / IAM 14324 / JCM 22182 / KY 12970) TaxID=764103 RepID=G7E5J2_MIXOS|nr:uncharacterized protein L969DRAFT_93284 [Mixia osmundae IAM 14324]KEI40750.1 hypothetical protein L969DRAFT_93284 [Mixia osmundae IAM 14324]GAA98102.1 hypothetical protein E5Q_04785 [Mixia osmundae IAM 14324]